MNDEPVVESTDENGLTTILLDRPEAMNSLTLAAKIGLRDTLRRVAADSRSRTVVIRGTGRAFSVGQDLNEVLAEREQGSPSNTVAEHYNPLARTIMEMPKPVVAGINGTVAGAGLSIALACDLRIAAESARLTTAFAGIALTCDTGISWTLQRVASRATALDLLLRPRVIDAAEALRLGLVNEVVPDAEFDEALASLGTELATGPTLALASIKRSVNHASTSTFESALEYEEGKMALTAASRDHEVAVEAFLAKQKPVFEGR